MHVKNIGNLTNDVDGGALPLFQGAESRHQTQDTTMVSTRVGAQIVSGDEAQAPQEINSYQ